MASVGAEASRGSKWRERVAISVCAVAYLYVVPVFPAINNPNENVRFYMTAAVVDDGSYEISEQRRKWGWTNDAAEVDGRYFSVKAPGTSLFGVPGYAAYRWGSQALRFEWNKTTALWICRVSSVTIPALYFLLFFYRFLRSATPSVWAAECVFYSVALGSLFYGYSLLFVSHSISAALAFVAFASIYQARHRLWQSMSRPGAFGVGFATAGVTFFEYPGLVISLILTVYALLSLRPMTRFAWFCGGALIPTVVMMHFQDVAFGSPWTPGHLFVENPSFRSVHEKGFFGATGIHPEALFGLLFNPAYGLFPLTPILIASPLGLIVLARQKHTRLDAIVVTLCCAVTTLAICTMLHWRGGWTLGPRYLAAVVPLLAWPTAVGLGKLGRRLSPLGQGAALSCLVIALVASGIPSAYYPHIPESFDRPLPQLFQILLQHGFAPVNGGQLFELYGAISMIPWAVAMGLAVLVAGSACLATGGLVIRSTKLRLSQIIQLGLVLLIALPVLGAGSWLLLGNGKGSYLADLKLVTERWYPEGHDQAARLERSLSEEPSPEGYRSLAELYEAEGRHDAATRARDQALRLSDAE